MWSTSESIIETILNSKGCNQLGSWWNILYEEMLWIWDFLITWYIGIFIYFLNHWKFHGQGSNQNWGTINLRKCWNDFTFDNQFIWRNWYVCHQESVENKKFKWQDKNGFLNLSPESVPKPTKSETKQTWIKNFFYEGPIKWYILLDDITMKKSKFSPDESRLFINGQEIFQTKNEHPIVVDVIVND